MRIELAQLGPCCRYAAVVRRRERGHVATVPNWRFSVTFITPVQRRWRTPLNDLGVLDNLVSSAFDQAFGEAMRTPVFENLEEVRNQTSSLLRDKRSRGTLVVRPTRSHYHLETRNPGCEVGVVVRYATDAAGRMHYRVFPHPVRTDPFAPHPGGDWATEFPERWRNLYPEFCPERLNSRRPTSPIEAITGTVWSDPTDALSWAALADAVEEAGEDPSMCRLAVQVIQEVLSYRLKPRANQRHPGLLWPGQNVNP